MAINTPYLIGDLSSQSNINTPYIVTGATQLTSDVSSAETLFVGGNLILRGALQSASAISGGAITGTTGTFTSTLTVGGLTTFTSSVTVDGFLNLNSQRTQSGFLSFATSASASSAILPDGALGVYYLSVSSMALAFRSGVTTYTIRATAASVL